MSLLKLSHNQAEDNIQTLHLHKGHNDKSGQMGQPHVIWNGGAVLLKNYQFSKKKKQIKTNSKSTSLGRREEFRKRVEKSLSGNGRIVT